MVGASQGLGREIALSLARAGADVACAARSALKLQETVNAIKDLGRQSIGVPTDVARERQVIALVNTTAETFKQIDILCGRDLPFCEMWDAGSFAFNEWTFAPDQGNWAISAGTGNPALGG